MNLSKWIAYLSIILNMPKLLVYKYIMQKKIYFQGLQKISSKTEITLNGENSELSLGRMVHTRGRVTLASYDGKIAIGPGTFFNDGCNVTAHDQIIIGEDCAFGPNVMVFDHDHAFGPVIKIKDGIFKKAPIIIGDNVWIGANSVILRGAKIGDNCVIGAGSIIKADIPPDSIVFQRRDTIIKQIE